ncbi:MAG TPA: YceI family protein [Gemmatimonadales bacterium]|nr:YceI family protein [Gemmatimonadales bacterium]
MNRRIAAAAGAALYLLLLAIPPRAEAQAVSSIRGDSRIATKWVVDPVHSQIDFRVRHLVGRVRGTFTRWYAVITTTERDWTRGVVNVSVQTSSLSTGNAYRDADLRSSRFFAVDSYPSMSFQGTGLAASDTTVEVSGVLTIKGHSHPVTLTGQYRGIAEDAEGHERIAFEASTVLDRRDYGMDWNQTVAGTRMIGDEVEITVALEAVRID